MECRGEVGITHRAIAHGGAMKRVGINDRNQLLQLLRTHLAVVVEQRVNLPIAAPDQAFPQLLCGLVLFLLVTQKKSLAHVLAGNEHSQ